MYLTRACLNPHLRGALALLSNPRRLHGAIAGSFPEAAEATAEGRVLWRLDNDTPSRPVLWIVSPYEPEPTNLIQQAGWPTLDPKRQWLTKPYKPLLDRLAVGQRYAFRLTANPTRSIRDKKAMEKPGRARGRRVGHTTVENQINWLVERSALAGFRILPSTQSLPGAGVPALDLQLTGRDNSFFNKQDESKQETLDVTISRASYLGGLEITDADKFRATLVRGVGRARAYGCGLVTIAANDAH